MQTRTSTQSAECAQTADPGRRSGSETATGPCSPGQPTYPNADVRYMCPVAPLTFLQRRRLQGISGAGNRCQLAAGHWAKFGVIRGMRGRGGPRSKEQRNIHVPELRRLGNEKTRSNNNKSCGAEAQRHRGTELDGGH